jgi:serine phosphatase RsbU (regulator of sigma subunit)
MSTAVQPRQAEVAVDRGVPVRAHISIRRRLLITINAIMLLGLGVLMVVDYYWTISVRLSDRREALDEEAQLLMPAIQAMGLQQLDRVQQLINRACMRMRYSTSPGHHIAVIFEGKAVLHAQTRWRHSPALAQTMLDAVKSPQRRARLDQDMILVGTARQGGVRILVSEYAANIRYSAREQLLWRLAGLTVLGLAVTVVVNLALLRLVNKPLRSLVSTVRAIASGKLGIQAPDLVGVELRFLAEEISAMSRSLADAQAHQVAQLEKARRIQANLLPPSDRLQSVGVHSVYEPSEDVGGDIFDVRAWSGHQLVVCVGDATGHGVPAAMSAAMLKTLFNQAACEPVSPVAILDEMNRGFGAVSLSGDFATMAVAVLDRNAGRISFASAGHENAYLISDGRVEPLASTGMLLGIEDRIDCTVEQRSVKPGDMLVLLTDGVTEAASADGTRLGRSRLEAMLREHAMDVPVVLVQSILREVESHRGGTRADDDVTIIVVRV